MLQAPEAICNNMSNIDFLQHFLLKSGNWCKCIECNEDYFEEDH